MATKKPASRKPATKKTTGARRAPPKREATGAAVAARKKAATTIAAALTAQYQRQNRDIAELRGRVNALECTVRDDKAWRKYRENGDAVLSRAQAAVDAMSKATMRGVTFDPAPDPDLAKRQFHNRLGAIVFMVILAAVVVIGVVALASGWWS